MSPTLFLISLLALLTRANLTSIKIFAKQTIILLDVLNNISLKSMHVNMQLNLDRFNFRAV